jgi:hypothetical protein
MNTNIELKPFQTEISKEITFFKKEIEFLLNLLKNCYSTSIEIEKVKQLDTYWKGFEDNIINLDLLLERIKKEENILARIYNEKPLEEQKPYSMNGDLMFEYGRILKTVKTLKEGFYKSMAGCCDCSFKKK